VPAFSAALRAYIAACLTLGDQLLRGIAIGMGLPEKFFAGQLAGPEGSYWVARVIHYPPLQRVDQQQQGGCLPVHFCASQRYDIVGHPCLVHFWCCT
jgi:isopenicillin N synthase-like dioxygenase